MPPPSKRRKTESKTEEISFDDTARHEYLTGFHKRKVQRAKHAQEIAERKAREERIEARKNLREERKADLERHVKQMDALFKPVEDETETGDGVEGDEGGEWGGLEDRELPPIDHEAEYIDEDKYTTVTVEAMDISKEGLSKLGQDPDGDNGDAVAKETEKEGKDDKKTGRAKTTTYKQKGEQGKIAKRKRKNFRYESKAERKVSRTKEKVKNSKQAKARRAG